MKTRAFTYGEISTFCHEMALMLRAGIGVAAGMDLLAQEEKDGQWKGLLTSMVEKMDEGEPFSTAMEQTGAFPAYMTGLLAVGENAGRLEEALRSLSSYYEERERMDHRIKSALLYPSVLLLLMLVVIVVLLTQVLPMFRAVYAGLGGEMTGVAGVLLQVGLWLNSVMPVLCVVLFAGLVLVAVFAVSVRARERVLSVWKRHWGDRGMMRSMNDACLAQAISMGLSSGLPMEESLELARQVLRDVPQAVGRVTACKQELENGEELSQALSRTDMFPKTACRLLGLGMQSGTGDETMGEIARRLSEEADRVVAARISAVEPTLVLISSSLVGAILLSVMLPLIHIMEMIA